MGFAAEAAKHFGDAPTPRARHWVENELGDYVWSKQGEVLDAVTDHPRVAVKACHDVGKALAVDTPLFRADGTWTTMGEVGVGDSIHGPHGSAVVVTETHPVVTRPCYRVTFSDGTSIVADADHRWVVHDAKTRQKLRARSNYTLADWRLNWDHAVETTTSAISGTLRREGKTDQLNWSIPVTSPTGPSPTALPVKPWTFGAWLGDGTSCRAELTASLPDSAYIAERLAADGYPPTVKLRKNGTVASVVWGRAYLDCPGRLIWGFEGTKAHPEAKAVPPEYLSASRGDRLELLRGIMDTDGFNSTGGSVGLDVVNPYFAAGTATLVRSLGWVARQQTKKTPQGKTVYRLQFRPDECPFGMPRKCEKWKPRKSQASRHTLLTITSVERVPDQPTRCITVSSPDGLFLAGEGLTPTHNSFTAAEVVAWWIAAHPVGEAFAVTTAPTFAQVRAILWREIGRAHRRGNLPGRVNQTEWHIGSEIVAFGRKPADWNPEAFAGIHAARVLVVLDEADAVPKAIWAEAEGMAANEDSRILAIGNPNNPNSHFAAVTQMPGWKTLKISAFDSPNFNRSEVIPRKLSKLLVGPAWVEARKEEWGEDSPTYCAKVLGEFPSQSEDQLISVDDVRRAMERDRTTFDSEADLVAVDVARFGRDRTVIVSMWGGREIKMESVRSGDDTMVTAGRVIEAMRETKAKLAKVDADGIGGAVIDRLTEQKVRVRSLQSGSRPRDRKRFVNAKAEWWWNLREMLERDELDLPNDDDLASELTSVRYEVDSRGRIGIESKDKMAKRGLRSPDLADAVVYAAAPVSGVINGHGLDLGDTQASAHNLGA